MRSDVSRTIWLAAIRTSRSTFRLRHAQPKAKRGGARRDRTDDLMLAKHALSQLSYGPEPEDECLCRMPVFARSASKTRFWGYAGHASLSSSVAAPRVAAREAWWAWDALNLRPPA